MWLLQRWINAADFQELWAEELIEPRGDFRGDIRMAQLQGLVANLFAERERGEAYKLSDFLIDYGEDRKTRRSKSSRRSAEKQRSEMWR